jgi:hypothetical protein
MLPGSQVPGYTTGATASLGDDKPIANEITFSIPLDFNKLKIRRELLVDPGRISLRRALDQVRRTLSRARIYDILPLRSHSAPENSSVPIFDGRCGALLILSAAVVDFRIYRIWLGLSDRGCCIDAVDYVVLPIMPCSWAQSRSSLFWRS